MLRYRVGWEGGFRLGSIISRITGGSPRVLKSGISVAPLLDIGLPEINGYEVAEHLRAAATQGLRLVAVTGYGRSNDRARTQAAGFDDHLVKPVEAIELKRVLQVCQRQSL